MGFVTRTWKDNVGGAVIAGLILAVILGGCGLIAHVFLGDTPGEVYKKAFTPVQLPHWLVWLWIAATTVLTALAARSLRQRPHVNTAVGSRAGLDPKIEIVTGPAAPYHVIDVQSGVVNSIVKIGIKNAGGKTLSNCKVFIEKISPPTNSPGGTTLLLDGRGFHLRHDESETLVDVAAHWANDKHFRFLTPLGSGFFDTTQLMDDNTRRTFAIRVSATECERSAMFEIWADESRKLHLNLINYI